jgi:hypothetical protein
VEIIVKIFLVIAPLVLVAAIVFGKQPGYKETTTLWEKLDQHEEAISE